MMQAMRRWQKDSILILLSTKIAAASESSATYSACFHSTPIWLEKRKSKWESDFRGNQQPPKSNKNAIRYAVRQKRADSRKALKDLLFYGGSIDNYLEEKYPVENVRWNVQQNDDPLDKKCELKSSARSRTRLRRRQRKLKKQCLYEDDYDDEHPEKIFRATFGDKSYTWSYKPWKEFSFDGKKTRVHHEEEMREWNARQQSNHYSSDSNHSISESYIVGSYSERSILGLPVRGPLKIEDVKNAFRLSALKWHPDKHQGPSQAAAEEKFKCCVTAYKSLCDALCPA
ncbi:unnamed protein product [Cuscuta epithymum]|uniref:J domain-containing protein n=1 Tax=Cuscuta epithymum TaxID=186058 RepID=A0AAV0C8Y3_9ASTE|nr:unnamed protein product [Cuscuta epithymum]